MAENKRLIWADALRCLLILFVVLGHSLQFGDFENRISWNIINSFHVAAFFFISGFVSYKITYKVSSIKRKFQQLMLPFLTWTLLGILIHRGGYTELMTAFLHPDGAYWFVWVLFFIVTLFILIHNISYISYISYISFKNRWNKSVGYEDLCLLLVILALILVMVVFDYRLYGFQFFALYFGFFVYGYWLRKFDINLKAWTVFLLGTLWLIFALFWRKHEVPLPLVNVSFVPASILTYSYRYITAFIGSLFFVGLAMNLMSSYCLNRPLMSSATTICCHIFWNHKNRINCICFHL